MAGRAGAESSRPKTVGLTEPLALHHSVKDWLWLAMLGRSGWGRSPHSGPPMGCTAHKKKWLAVGFVYKRCGMFAPKTDLGNPSCHPCSSLCWQGFISQNSIISKPWKMDLEQGKDLLSWLANSSVSFFFPPWKVRRNCLIVALSLKLRKHAGKLGTCLGSQSSSASRVLMADL